MTKKFNTDDPVRQSRSEYYGYGAEDGVRDTITVNACPPGVPLGKNLELAWSWMYGRGYDDAYRPAPCPCDGSCKSGKQYGQAPDERHQ